MMRALSVGNSPASCGRCVVIGNRMAIRPQVSLSTSLVQQPVRLTLFSKQTRRPQGFHVRASDTATAAPQQIAPAIVLTENATTHLKRLKADKDSLYLRVGVRQGGCSGMSYVMDFEDASKIRADDSKIEADGITLVCDPKSLLFLFGMQLDYSEALIGGGFSFSNPNATSTCGCGKSFAA